MPDRTLRLDAVVVGAGTSGANVAYQLASRGLRVALVERRPAHHGGAHWSNGVLDWQFERAGLEPPSGAERVDANAITHIVGPEGQHAVSLTSPTVTADMGLLGRRLRTMAAAAGCTLVDRAEHLTVEVVSGRMSAVEVSASFADVPEGASVGEAVDTSTDEPPAPGRLRLEAPLFVDAAGRQGVLRRHSPALDPWCPTVRGDELCSAADFHLLVADRGGAERFLARHGAAPGETVTSVGVAGGFSTCAVTVAADLGHARVLVGCLANGRYGTGPRLLADLRDRESWLGEPVSGGFGVIPLRRPYARFTAPGLAVVGDAAAQVYPAHGSGIGLGLIAGSMLADASAGADDPGDERTLWRYQLDFQREFGGLLLASDLLRRLSTELGTAGVRAMVESGLMIEPLAHAGLDQRPPDVAMGQIQVMAGRLVRAPGLAKRVLPRLARGQLAEALASRYPESVDTRALARWDRQATRLLGAVPT